MACEETGGSLKSKSIDHEEVYECVKGPNEEMEKPEGPLVVGLGYLGAGVLMVRPSPSWLLREALAGRPVLHECGTHGNLHPWMRISDPRPE